MPQVEVIGKDSKSVGKADLPDSIFGVEVKRGLLHEVVRNHNANKRQGTACTKTKGLVRGGGRKPFKQKGTGRARQGSNRSPLLRGGGTVFGPSAKRLLVQAAQESKMARSQLCVDSKTY